VVRPQSDLDVGFDTHVMEATMGMQLGRLERQELRTVWVNEASGFTPWLAQPENLAILGQTLGLSLELEAQEQAVGPFRADILCRDLNDGHWVLIENQLERTDHYGFGDLHINLALREWLEFAPERSIEIVSPGARDIPSFLLHLSPQVRITPQTATDYLDRIAGITRSRLEKLEKRADGMLRVLGKKRAKRKMAAYHATEQERAGQALLAKLQSLPLKDGKPDVSSIGDPAESAKRWAAEVKMSPEETIEPMIDLLENDKTT
jgi:hypothetical protein